MTEDYGIREGISFGIHWRKPNRYLHQIHKFPELVCAGDILFFHDLESRALVGYSVESSNPDLTPIKQKDWWWNINTEYMSPAMSPIKSGFHLIFADGCDMSANLVDINLLTLNDKRVEMKLTAPLNSDIAPIMLQGQNDKQNTICYTGADQLYFYIAQKDNILLKHSVRLEEPNQKWWQPVGFYSHILHLSNDGSMILSTISTDRIESKTHSLSPQRQYFQPTVFFDQIYGDLILLIPYHTQQNGWFLKIGIVSEYTDFNTIQNAFSDYQLQFPSDEGTFSVTGLSSLPGCIFVHGKDLHHVSLVKGQFHSADIRIPWDQILLTNHTLCLSNLFIACDASDQVFAFDLVTRRIVNHMTINTGGSTSPVLSGPIYTGNHIIWQNTKELICLKI